MNNGSTYVGLGERMAQRMAPTCDWTDMGSDDHFVQFFESDEYIVNQVSEYIIHGLRTGETCIAVATSEHLAGIENAIQTYSYDLEQARRDGRFLSLDAHETLARIMNHEAVNSDKFLDVIGTLVDKAAKRGKGVRIFGEMVGVLCSTGRFDAAVELENLWNVLRKRRKFSLFCGYSMTHLQKADATLNMGAICSGHTHVLPTEVYSSITNANERLKHIAMLQQRNKQLEAEITELEKSISARRSESDFGSMVPSPA